MPKIYNLFPGFFIMFKQKVIDSSRIISISAFNVFYDCHSYHLPVSVPVNTFRWNQQTSETSVIERVWGDPHQDKSHRRTGCQMAILLNMGGSCSVCVPLYITKRSEAVLQWGKRKNIKKMMINGELVIE